MQIDATDGTAHVTFSGTKNVPFFTAFLGKHQILENGNILITESRGGRALEITADGRLVWEYVNFVKPGVVGLLDEAQRLPPGFDAAFFARSKARCADSK